MIRMVTAGSSIAPARSRRTFAASEQKQQKHGGDFSSVGKAGLSIPVSHMRKG
jgi:hypothetical protein